MSERPALRISRFLCNIDFIYKVYSTTLDIRRSSTENSRLNEQMSVLPYIYTGRTSYVHTEVLTYRTTYHSPVLSRILQKLSAVCSSQISHNIEQNL